MHTIMALVGVNSGVRHDSGGHPAGGKSDDMPPRRCHCPSFKSAWPNGIHPDWSGQNTIDRVWALIVDDETTDMLDVRYLHGNIVSPRGGVVTKGAFVIAKEWEYED